MGRLARGTVEAEATRMRDEPGLGRGGEGIVCLRPCRGVSDEAEKEKYVRGPAGGVSDEAEDERLVFHADSESTGTRI